MSSIIGMDSRPLIKCSGPGPDRVSVACNDLNNDKIMGIVSFGIAGGMDPKLKSGSVLLPKAVVTDDGAVFQTDDTLRRSVAKNWPVAREQSRQLGVNKVIKSIDEKMQLFQATGAHALDMESHVIAAYAKKRGIPFLILRSIADSAKDTVPEIALAGMNKNGRATALSLLRKLIQRPSSLTQVAKLAYTSNTAMRALKKMPASSLNALCKTGNY
ncbi:MAG: hypothetical protein VX941_07315 [Pseudomonadota bacterium]|nr:hypothetical protein [Pseudomonadota bacterium]